jgi:sugar (pentulose or hexulose) kinase/phosphoglycerate dehydrogenase-like enzyme/ribulose-5-phosphate 4-epimerase/fuculose-1-phosphate aldolase
MERAGAAPAEVLGIAATSMRHSTIVLDAGGNPLLAAANRDSRAVGEAFQFAAECGDAVYLRTGHWPSAICSAARLQWLATNNPAAWKQAVAVISLSDWLTYRLCGTLASEPSQAAETLLLDVAKRDWAADLAEWLKVPFQILPPLRASGERIGSLTAEAASALGLQAGTPVGIGGGDTQCGALGAGAIAVGDAGAIVGTTAPLQVVVDSPLIDSDCRLWTCPHVIPTRWVLESNAGPMGENLDWLAHVIFPDSTQPAARLLAEAGLSEPGARGIISTLGTSVMNAREMQLPTGSLTLSHLTAAHDPESRRHLLRAIIEGMAYALRANLDQIQHVGQLQPTAMNLAGGVSRSATFASVLTDVLAMPVRVGPTGEATALGAAICAGVAAGVFADLEEGSRTFAAQLQTVQPDKARAAAYAEGYNGWRKWRTAQVKADEVAVQIILPHVLRAMTDRVARADVTIRPRVVVTADMDEEALRTLRELGDVDYRSFRQTMHVLSGPALVEALAGAQVFVTEVDVLDARSLARLPDLRVVAACRVDAVNVDRAACTAYGIPVLYAPGRNAEAVADLTLAFLLMLARRLSEASAFLHRSEVETGDMGRMGQAFTTLQGRELWHKTVGLVGFGAVGHAVTRRLTAFGARVLVFDPFLPPEAVLRADAEPVSLEELLERSDFVSLHAAVTEGSKEMIGAAQLAAMKTGACLVNTARAALVDEKALLNFLQTGHLAGAALDVFSVEPPGWNHPLLACENVIATPHVGGNTVEVGAHQGRIVAADLRRLLCRQTPRHVTNPEVLTAFDWTKPRAAPDPAILQSLSAGRGAAVSDLQRDKAAQTKAAAQPVAAAPAAVSATLTAEHAEVGGRVERILQGFIGRMTRDPSLRAFAADQDVTLHFTLPDLGLSFHFRLRAGEVTGDLGDPDAPAEVKLKMPAAILDGMFTGTVNPMQAASTGGLSFQGDTLKAMTLQYMQDDLSRLYRESRDEVGDPGDLAALAAPASGAAARAAAPVGAGDIRTELIEVVHELYTAQLLTATGGNVSARIPGSANEIWITPSQLFKGNMRPEILVRIDLDGQPLDADALSPSSERLMHCAVYRARSEAGAVIHAHAPYATILANTGLPFLPVSTEAAFFGDIPRVPFIMPGSEELANAVGDAAGKSWAVLMQNHGLIVAGRTLRRAADMVEIVERSAQIILGCRAAGKESATLPDDIVRTLQKLGDVIA